jgi:hypothetical protein
VSGERVWETVLDEDGARDRVNAAMMAAMKEATPGKEGVLDDASLREIAAAGVDALDLSRFREFAPQVRELLIQESFRRLQTQQGNRIRTGQPLTSEEIRAQVGGMFLGAEAELEGAFVKTDPRAQIGIWDRVIGEAETLVAQAGPGAKIADSLEAIQEAKAKRAALEVADIDAVRKADQAAATSKAQIAAIGRQAAEEAINKAVAGGDINAITAIMDMANRSILDNVEASLRAAVAAAEYRERKEAELGAIINGIDVGTGGLPGALGLGPDGAPWSPEAIAEAEAQEAERKRRRGTGGAADKERKKLDDFLKGRRRSTAPAKDGAWVEGEGSGNPLLEGAQETAAEIEAARLAAMAAGRNDQLAQARAAVQVAQANVNKIANDPKQGTDSVAYWNAVGQLNQAEERVRQIISDRGVAIAQLAAARTGGGIANAQGAIAAARAALSRTAAGTVERTQAMIQLVNAQNQMDQAMFAYQRNLDLLHGDNTDPVEQGADALRDIRRRLADARRRGAKDDIAELEVQERKQIGDNQITALNQRLKLAEHNKNMGRLSHQAYLSMIQAEMNRLKITGLKTEQQREAYRDLESRQKALADELQGQFNLGDIRLPTVYQARRAALGGGYQMPGGNRNVSTQTNNIQIDGADIATIKRIFADLLGPTAGRTGTHTRKT